MVTVSEPELELDDSSSSLSFCVVVVEAMLEVYVLPVKMLEMSMVLLRGCVVSLLLGMEKCSRLPGHGAAGCRESIFRAVIIQDGGRLWS
jgi:hypothetical protein